METPECKYGYTEDQLKRMIPVHLWGYYWGVSYGSTRAMCEGGRCGGEHGPIAYTWDVEKFFRLAEREGRL